MGSVSRKLKSFVQKKFGKRFINCSKR